MEGIYTYVKVGGGSKDLRGMGRPWDCWVRSVAIRADTVTKTFMLDYFHKITKHKNRKGYWGGGVDVTMGRLQMLFGLSAVGTFIGAMQ